LAITVCWVYGAAVYIYCDGKMDWMGFDGMAKSGGVGEKGVPGAMVWFTPVMSFSVMVGLGA
jgi:hypothetical protein